jgi:branched-chain amino acid transport system substrate-binding protein
MRPTVACRVATAVVTAGALVSCSPVGDLLAHDEERGPPTAEIVVLAPQEAHETAAGVVAAVQLALEDEALVATGWTVRVVAVDEAPDAATAAEGLAEKDEVVAVVGGLSGEAVRAVQPVLAAASIPFVSPADVAPEHTRGADPANPLRPYASYFRTSLAGGDAIETAADYAVRGLGAQKIAVVDGGGSDETARFTAEVRWLGAEVVASAPAGADGAGIAKVIAAAVSAKADVIYAAGDAVVAAEVAKRLAGTGLDAKLVGSSTLRSETFVTAAGTAADGAVAVVAPMQRQHPGDASGDRAARLAERGVDAPGLLAATAYDAGTAVAKALSRCLPAHVTAAAARQACVAEMQQVSFAGVTGEVRFDSFGDRAGSRPAVYELRDGGWMEIGAA